MITLLIFLVVLSVLVVFHEFGHYLAARIFGVKAEEFGVGFPPRAIGFVREHGKWKKVSGGDRASYANTIWSLNWLPLGGFVRLKGEQDAKDLDKDSFAVKPAYARAIILFAGVAMNWLLAILIFTVGFSVGVPTDLEGVPAGAIVRDRCIEITQVLTGSPAATAGLQGGDSITRIGTTPIVDADQARRVLAETSKDLTSFSLQVRREGKELTLPVSPIYLESIKRPGIGIGLADVGIVRLPIHRAFVQAVTTTFLFTKMIVSGFGEILRNLVVNLRPGADLSGPVGIAVMTGKIAAQGFWPLMQFAAILSINLAVVNLLPIPALDGGRLVFVALEVIRRRKASLSMEARFHQVGFVLLLALIALITIRDVSIYGAPLWHALRGRIGF